jgi:benzylsuccinate CoA-transferase BbsF subunit
MGHSGLTADPRFASLRARQDNVLALDEILGSWTRTRDARELAETLRSRGVAAYKSLNSIDMVADEHLWQRGFYTHVVDGKNRSLATLGGPWRLSATPASVHRAAPILGEHNDYVLGDLLGLSASERQRLVASKVIY